jgi:hypothetical protein
MKLRIQRLEEWKDGRDGKVLKASNETVRVQKNKSQATISKGSP